MISYCNNMILLCVQRIDNTLLWYRDKHFNACCEHRLSFISTPLLENNSAAIFSFLSTVCLSDFNLQYFAIQCKYLSNTKILCNIPSYCNYCAYIKWNPYLALAKQVAIRVKFSLNPYRLFRFVMLLFIMRNLGTNIYF